MANSDFLVRISGPALSILFYENVRNRGDQIGFLLGEILEFVTEGQTDLDNQVKTVKTYNNIEAVVSWPLSHYLYDSIGRINKNEMEKFASEKGKQVIGWFHFRRDMPLVPTLRDKMLHTEFASCFAKYNGCKEKFFVTCLLSSSTSSEKGTHKFKHVFFRKNRTFEPVPLRISNIGSNSFEHEKSEYKPIPTRRSHNVPDVFSLLIESLNLDFARTSSVESAHTIQREAEQHLSRLIPELCKSDVEVALLENKLTELKQNKWKETDTETVLRVGQKTPSINSISELRVNVTDCMANKNRGSSIMAAGIAKESVCKNETSVSGVGRERRRGVHNVNSNLRKDRRNSTLVATQDNSERTLCKEIQQMSNTNSVQTTNTTTTTTTAPSQQVSYSQVAKKKTVNTRQSSTTNDH